jgi:hypothetical protein
MKGDLDYIAFRERLLVAIADAQEPPGLAILELEPLCKRVGLSGPVSWFEVVAADLEDQRFGRDLSSHGIHYFLIAGAGLAEAARLRREGRPKSLGQKVAAVKAEWWALGIAVVSLVISVLK